MQLSVYSRVLGTPTSTCYYAACIVRSETEVRYCVILAQVVECVTLTGKGVTVNHGSTGNWGDRQRS